MRVVFLGSGAFATPTLKWLSRSLHRIALVVTQPARGSGRGRRVTRTPVRAEADKLGLETLETADVNQPDVIATLQALDIRLGLVVAFGQKLGPEVLSLFPGGCLNLHASLLPKYRGAAPINWAVAHGEPRSGCTVFRIVQQMDAGPILASRWTAIKPEETAGELHDRLAGIGVDAVEAALQQYENGNIPPGHLQDDALATRAPKLKKEDGIIDFAQPASRVAHYICGMTPWPGATTRYQSADQRWERVTIVRARPAETPESPPLPPGTIDERRYVAALDGYVEILEIKPSSGRRMSWRDFVNGRHVAAGDRFISSKSQIAKP